MSDMNADIVAEFRANDGRVGGQFEGAPLILIHHIGVKSGTEYVTPVGCFPQSDMRFAVIASNGGARMSPAWYYNLKAHPEITVEFGREVFAVVATELEGRERANVWTNAVITAPQLEEYQAMITRTIPVLMLTRTSSC